MHCTIWYHLDNLKNVKNIHGGVLLLVKFQALACNFTKSNTHPWVFFTFLNLYKCHQIAQRTMITKIRMIINPFRASFSFYFSVFQYSKAPKENFLWKYK